MANSPIPVASQLESHGQSTDLAVALDAQIDVLTLTGVNTAGNWSHLMTRRAAHALWYRLTWELFPEKSARVTSMAATAPLRPPKDGQIVTQVEVIHQVEWQRLSVIGWNTAARWRFEMDDRNARQLWAALDVALYPAGWAGASVTYKRS
jgi:hypothetical protein